jgi:hypothetical protein
MRTPAVLAIGVAMALGIVAVQPVLSGGGKGKGKLQSLDPGGHPKAVKKGGPRYLVWHDAGGWHLRAHGGPVGHHFVGAIHVDDGTIKHAHSAHLEKEGTLQDHWRLDMPGRQHLAFNFKTQKEVDGVTFHVSKSAKNIYFDLRIDGLAHPERVLIGRDATHPTTNPFYVSAHPKGKKK